MENELFDKLECYSNKELRKLIEQSIDGIDEFEGIENYLTIKSVKRQGKIDNFYSIYNFIDREELSFPKERQASMQFIELLLEAGYLQKGC